MKSSSPLQGPENVRRTVVGRSMWAADDSIWSPWDCRNPLVVRRAALRLATKVDQFLPAILTTQAGGVHNLYGWGHFQNSRPRVLSFH